MHKDHSLQIGDVNQFVEKVRIESTQSARINQNNDT